MRQSTLLYLTLVLAAAGAVLNYLAGFFYLYWTYWWFDILVHSLVGFTGGLGLYWGLFCSGIIFRGRFASKLASVALVFACVMAVGIGWEIFEYSFGITDSYEKVYALDVALDLISDATGALLAALIGVKYVLDRHDG